MLKSQKKIEIIIESIKVDKIISILEEEGVGGYTIVGNISGKGRNGVLDHNCKAKIFENTYIFSICDESRLEQILIRLREVLEYYSGACFVSDIQMLNLSENA